MFNVQSINTVVDCDAILADAGQMKSSIEIRIMSAERQLGNIQSLATALPGKLVDVDDRLNFLNAQQVLLQDGKRKEDNEMELNILDNERRAILDKMQRYSPEYYLERSWKLACDTASLDKVNEVITAVQARKVELTAAAAA